MPWTFRTLNGQKTLGSRRGLALNMTKRLRTCFSYNPRPDSTHMILVRFRSDAIALYQPALPGSLFPLIHLGAPVKEEKNVPTPQMTLHKLV